MQISVNGEKYELADGASLDHLLEQMGLDRRYLVVEYNGEPLRRERFADLRLAEGDRLELVRPVAGG
jgi:thiamine biosynthesis protein ThiS